VPDLAWLCSDADVDAVARQLNYSTNPMRPWFHSPLIPLLLTVVTWNQL
jgi:hypothetical protein